jgi:co-chaperonin GroES (HSP10)
MSSVGLYGFEIPHDFVQPTRDMVIIRIPFPPKKIGSIITPQTSRDLLAHNVMAGRVVAMGPLAFSYKDGDGLKRQNVGVGDWVMIRPFAGTMVQGGQIMVTSGWRYVSSFNDVIGIIPADRMPEPETLVWENDEAEPDPAQGKLPLSADIGVRERVVYKK